MLFRGQTDSTGRTSKVLQEVNFQWVIRFTFEGDRNNSKYFQLDGLELLLTHWYDAGLFSVALKAGTPCKPCVPFAHYSYIEY